VHLTAYTVLKRQLLDCLGQFLESNGGQFLASAEGLSPRGKHDSQKGGHARANAGALAGLNVHESISEAFDKS
jgi:hypothetical protein